MQFRVLLLVLASVIAFPLSAFAATVSPMSGEVRIGTGHGFQKIDAPTEVAAGAQVMVSPDGSASIAYAGNCVVSASPAAITVVERRAPCAHFPEPSYFGFARSNEQGVVVGEDLFGFTPKVDDESADNGSSNTSASTQTTETPSTSKVSSKKGRRADTSPVPLPPSSPEEEESHSGHTWLVIGGVVVGGGVLAALLASQGGDHPASP